MAPAITAVGLCKTFQVPVKEPGLRGSIKAVFRPSRRAVDAVRDLSFTVARGEIVACIGPNGAGKSTTIKMLTGILFPTAGEAVVLGLVPWRDRARLNRRIATVFGQRSQLWYHLPPADTFELLGRIYEMPGPEYRARVKVLGEEFGLGEVWRTPVRKLSLGQRMRCEVAAAFLHRPEVVFLDEPTIGLDVVAKAAIREMIRRLNREEGVTVETGWALTRIFIPCLSWRKAGIKRFVRRHPLDTVGGKVYFFPCELVHYKNSSLVQKGFPLTPSN